MQITQRPTAFWCSSGRPTTKSEHTLRMLQTSSTDVATEAVSIDYPNIPTMMK